MRRVVAILVVAGLAGAAAAPAGAQEQPAPPPPLSEEMPERDPCEGADADYQYAYCDEIPAAGDDESAGGDAEPALRPRPVAAATLAATGAETRFLVVAGLGLLFAGVGLRLRLGS